LERDCTPASDTILIDRYASYLSHGQRNLRPRLSLPRILRCVNSQREP